MVKIELNVPRELARTILVQHVLTHGTHLVDKAGKIRIVHPKYHSWYDYNIQPEVAAECVINGTMTTCVDPRTNPKLVQVYGGAQYFIRVYEDPENTNNNSYDYWQCDNRWAKSTMLLIDRDYLNKYTVLWSSKDPVKSDVAVPNGTEWAYPSGTRFKFYNGVLYATRGSSSWNASVIGLAILQKDLMLGLCKRFNPDLSIWTKPIEPDWLRTVTDYIP